MSKCCIVGMGYIGLPTASIVAKSNHSVIGIDINPNIVETINKGNIHFFEPGLEKVVNELVSSKKLIASLKPVPADIFIIAVPTPFKEKKEGIPEPDIQYVLNAAESIAPYLEEGNLVIVESTCPVGTTEKLKLTLKEHVKCDLEKIHICYCPERVIPGNILKELISNNRVIGGLKPADSKLAKEFYKTFCKGEIKLTNARTAELVKLIENTFRDVNIAFANELSIIADYLEVDIDELIYLSNQHPRVNILKPGCGVGGHCIAIDPWFLASALPDDTHLIQTARNVNNKKVSWVIKKVKERAKVFEQENGRSPKIGCFGLTFKPDVDDIRESPAKIIIEDLKLSNLDLLICEPNLKELCKIKLYDLDYVFKNADFLVFLVAHEEFKNLNLKNKAYFDVCGVTS